MNTSDGFDRTVSEWLHADAEHRVPDHLDAVLRRTRTERQRPAWSSLERWLPVQTTIRISPTPRLPWLVALVVLIIALMAAGLYVASRPRLPAPFGPARDGLIVSSHDGDIYALDPRTQTPKLLIGGDPFDFAPNFSRDGTKMLFLRGAAPISDTTGLTLMVANSDGTAIRALTPEAQGLDAFDWSPDGKQVVFLSRPKAGGPGSNNVVNVDGTGLKTLDVGRPADSASWLPPLGQEIVFRGQQLLDTDPAPGIWAVHPDGTGLRELSARPAVNTGDSMVLAVSPDGTRVSYTDGNSDISRVHILDIATGADIALPDPTGFMHQFGPAVFSPDGRSIAYQRDDGDGTHQLVVAPSDGSGTGTPIGPRPAGSAGDIIYAWTPDGSAIIAAYDADQTARLLPVDGSTSTVLSRGSFAFVDVQRVAP